MRVKSIAGIHPPQPAHNVLPDAGNPGTMLVKPGNTLSVQIYTYRLRTVEDGKAESQT